jgi:hypothetical protein
MRTFDIVYMDAYDEVRDFNTGETIFSTKGIDPKVIDDVVIIWNKTGSPLINLFSEGEVDDYLLNSPDCTQEDRTLITEALYLHSRK